MQQAAIIPLSTGRRFAIVDVEDYDWATEQRWHFVASSIKNRAVGYARQNEGVTMHRLLMRRWSRLRPEHPELVIDHRNTFGTDNRRVNLHLVTRKENSFKRRLYCNNHTGFRGVIESDSRWHVQINVPGPRRGHKVHVGTFATFNDARDARLAAEREHGLTILQEADAAREKLTSELCEFASNGLLEMIDDPSLPLESRFLLKC